MNPRAATLRVLGWCPGMRYAARFLPDNNLPPIKIAASILIGLMITFTGFNVAQQLQLSWGVWGGAWKTTNENPSLVAAEDGLHLFITIRTEGIGLEAPIESSVRARIDLQGKVYEKNYTPGEGDAIITRDGLWLLAYSSDGIKVSESLNGEYWGAPVTVAENVGEKYGSLDEYLGQGKGYMVYEEPTLTEMGDGRVLMVFTGLTRMDPAWVDGELFIYDSRRVYYSVRGLDGEWTIPAPVPGLEAGTRVEQIKMRIECVIQWAAPLEPSCFTFLDGSAGVLAIELDEYVDEVVGVWLIRLDGDEWEEPRHLPYVRGRNPRVLGSQTLGGYVLAYGNLDQAQVEVAYTLDLEGWGKFTPLLALEGSRLLGPPTFAELDGVVVVAYERFPDVYLFYGGGGSEWLGPVRVETIVSDDDLMFVGAARMTVVSVLVGGVLGGVALIVALNLLGREVKSTISSLS